MLKICLKTTYNFIHVGLLFYFFTQSFNETFCYDIYFLLASFKEVLWIVSNLFYNLPTIGQQK